MEYQKKVIIQVFDYLAQLPSNDPYIYGPALLDAIRAEGDNTLQASSINDAVNYLREKNAVDVVSALGTSPYDFAFVKISITGINIRTRGDDIFKSAGDSSRSEAFVSNLLYEKIDTKSNKAELRKIVEEVAEGLPFNMFSGNMIPKNSIPDYFIEQYSANNLYQYRHSSGYNIYYSLLSFASGLSPVILDITLYSITEYDSHANKVDDKFDDFKKFETINTNILGFVAYFDILGFSELIKEDDFSEKIQHYNDILNEAVIKDNRELDYIFFSDSVIINSHMATESDLLNIINAISEIMYRLMMELGLTICGSVSYGNFSKFANNGNVMITGTPILDAHHLETIQNWVGAMISPRIVRAFKNLGEKTTLEIPQCNLDKKLFEDNLLWKISVQRYSHIPLSSGVMNGYVIIPHESGLKTCNEFVLKMQECHSKLDDLSLYAPDPYSQKKYLNACEMLDTVHKNWSKLETCKSMKDIMKKPLKLS